MIATTVFSKTFVVLPFRILLQSVFFSLYMFLFNCHYMAFFLSPLLHCLVKEYFVDGM